MKWITLVLSFFTLISLDGQGIEFFEGTWEEGKLKAMEEKKLLFVDAFAKWCGPCKRMAKNVFTNPSVGEYINENFIPMKIDMEEAEGRKFGQQYPVSAYPTLFFIDEEGEVIKKQIGALQSKEFLDLAKMVVRSYDRSDDYAKLYDEGHRDFETVLNYIKALNSADKPSLKVSNEFLRSAEDLSREQRAEILFEALTQADSRIFDLFIEEKDLIEGLKGVDDVAAKIEAACWNTVYQAIDFESEDLLEEAKDKMKKYALTDPELFNLEADYECAKALAQPGRISESAMAIAKKKYKDRPEELHQLAEELEMYSTIDQRILDTSEKIAAMAVDLEESPGCLITYARILYRNNKRNKAARAAEKALELAVMNPRMAKEAEELLQMIEQG